MARDERREDVSPPGVPPACGPSRAIWGAATRKAGVSVEEALRAKDWDFPDAADAGTIHALHPYPAKFISAIPRALIETLGVAPGTMVLDPFCGAGTTLVVAQELGVPSLGIDLNPIACLITRVKTTPLPNGLMEVASCVANDARSAPPQVPSIPNLDHWFTDAVQQALAVLTRRISAEGDSVLREHMRFALSSMIVRVSNQESDTRYAAVEKHVTFEGVLEQFVAACARLVDLKGRQSCSTPTRVIEANLLSITPTQIDAPVSLVVTSPPYPNAYEYWLYHKYRMWWLGYDPLAVKAQEIGARAHYFKKNHATFAEFKDQMASVLRLLASVLVPGGYACFVIGRSRIHGVDYDSTAMLSTEAQRASFTEVARITRLIRPSRKAFNLSHARIKTEDILVLQAAA